MEKNIIKIQRCYRIYKLSKLFDSLDKYNLNKKNINFNEYTINIKNKYLINNVNQIIYSLNKLFCKSFKISPRIIITAYLINNYTEEVIGPSNDRHPIDNLIIEWSSKLVNVLKKESNYFEYNLLLEYLNNYVKIFNNWKKIDKNRTIQNIIISYGNRMDHLDYVTKSNLEENEKNKIITSLKNDCKLLLKNISIIDKDFDINYLKQNYKEIINEIKESFSKIYNDISDNFKNAYRDILIKEFQNDNSNIILNLINETNNRILLLTPKYYVNSVKKKLNSFDYINNLLIGDYKSLSLYLSFLIDTIVAYSSPESNDENNKWKNELNNWLNSDTDIDYKIIIPSLLLEINKKIDDLINKINNLI